MIVRSLATTQILADSFRPVAGFQNPNVPHAIDIVLWPDDLHLAQHVLSFLQFLLGERNCRSVTVIKQECSVFQGEQESCVVCFGCEWGELLFAAVLTRQLSGTRSQTCPTAPLWVETEFSSATRETDFFTLKLENSKIVASLRNGKDWGNPTLESKSKWALNLT